MSSDERQMLSYYAARATEYDSIYLKPERQADLRAIESWLPPMFLSASVLEVACGTGYWTQFVARVADRVVAIDTSPETMEIARGRVPECKVDFRVADAYKLPPELGTFNAAFAGFWFSHVPRARRHEFLSGLHAVLGPGAKVVLLDNLYVEGSSTPIAETDAGGNTYQLRRLKDGSTHRVLKNFPSEAEMHLAIDELGQRGTFNVWEHYWAFDYVTAQS